MPITFNCPQGHRLTCPDELAGKPGKCPKCGVVVRVPSPAAVATALAPMDAAAADEPASALESAADGVTPSSLGMDQIIFLCPNGHRLHGSVSLAGRPGQCPHCGIKFLVPSPDDEEDDPSVQRQPQDALDEIVIQIDTSSKVGSSKSGRASSKSASSLAASVHPLAGILAQMLRYKAQGATIEIHMAGGTMIVPDQFSPKDAQHAFFASREADGTSTVTVARWSSIERVVLRGLAEIPKEWF
jgi:hypothetical protein